MVLSINGNRLEPHHLEKIREEERKEKEKEEKEEKKKKWMISKLEKEI